MNMKKILAIILMVVLFLSVVGCSNETGKKENVDAKDNIEETVDEKETFVVGTTGLFQDVLFAAKEDFEKSGCKLEIKVFDDTVTPNVALLEGSIDANFYQNGPFLKKFNEERETNLTQYENGLVTTFFGLYSNNIKSLDELKEGAKIAIPNEGSNMARSLKLLDYNGLIKIKEGVDYPTKLDIVENPKNLEIIEMGGWNVIESLPDVDAGVTSSSVALKAEIDPKSAIATYESMEKEDYSIIIVVDEDNMDEKYVKLLKDCMSTDKVKKAIEEDYNGGLLPLF